MTTPNTLDTWSAEDETQSIDSFSRLIGAFEGGSVDVIKVEEFLQLQLQQFAADPDFETKMTLAFGENDYSDWQSQFSEGSIQNIPAIQILPTETLQGANAAYAGSTNTIYFSDSFLTQYSDQPEIVGSVLLEEFGHFIDWEVNQGIDSPGDEGELFSNLIQGTNINTIDLQNINLENDQILIKFSEDNSTGTEIKFDSFILSETNEGGLQHSYDYIGPKFSEGQEIFNSLIEQRGKTLVFFINGGIGNNYEQQKTQIESYLSIGDDIPSSVTLAGYNNTSEFPPDTSEVFFAIARSVSTSVAKAATLALLSGGIGAATIPIAIAKGIVTGLASVYGTSFAKDSFEFLYQAFSDDPGPSNKVNENWNGEDEIVQLWLQNPNNSAIFFGHSQGNMFLEDGLQTINPDPGQVAIISLGSPTDYSSVENINDFNLLNSIKDDDPITFFQPDIADARFSEVANYLEEVIRNQLLATFNFGGSFILAADISGEISISKIANEATFMLQDEHHNVYEIISGSLGVSEEFLGDLFSLSWDNPNSLDRYLTSEFKNSFGDIENQLQPDGYYFRNGKSYSSFGTEYDDWLEGSNSYDYLVGLDGNDALWGNGGDDTLIGGDGYNFLDGGYGMDTASYNSGYHSGGIYVQAGFFDGHEVYRVIHGSDLPITFDADGGDFGYHDLLVNIEIIQGSGSMIGGSWSDIFYGAVTGDYLKGNDGDDRLYGLVGQDVLYGDDGEDILYGDYENGSELNIGDDRQNADEIYGGEGDDRIYGGRGNDTLDGGTDRDKIVGGAGLDNIYGGSDRDFIYGDFEEIQDYDSNDFIGDIVYPSGISQRLSNNVYVETSFSYQELNSDRIFGQGGDDIIYAGYGNDFVSGDEGVDLIYGESGNDHLEGGTGGDYLSGGLGNDAIWGQDGNDFALGGSGNDSIEGGNGNDTVDAGSGNDVVSGGNGNDTIYGNSGDDLIYGDFGDDQIYGGNGDDLISGGDDNDEIYGDDGADLIQGDRGDDLISGGVGDDILSGNEGNDTIYGDAGKDLLHGNEGDDFISGGLDDDLIYGDIGNDELLGDEGQDKLYGGDGADSIAGGADDDLLYGEAGDDYIEGNDGADQIAGGDGADEIHGGAGDDFINGQTGNDKLYGDDGNDLIYGEEGDDQIYGGNGGDRMIGGAGGDRLDGGNGDDIISYYTSNEGVYIHLQPGRASGGDAQGDRIYNVENVEGSYHDDTLIGDNGDNTLIGLDGDDELDGKAGDDELYGGNGNDYLEGRQGNDLMVGGNGDDYLDGSSGDDSIVGGAGNDTLYGGRSGNDIFSAGSGDDYINASSGDDIIYAGLGNDTIDAGSHNDLVAGGAGNDLIEAGSGDDWVHGGRGSDLIEAGSGDDWVHGGRGNDILRGHTGNDTLIGGAGNDILEAHAGDNLLVGGFHDDILYGGSEAGTDTFVLSQGWGIETIFNFDIAHDILGLFDDLTAQAIQFTKGTGANSKDTLVELAATGETLAILKDVKWEKHLQPNMIAIAELPVTLGSDPLAGVSEPPAPPILGGSEMFPGPLEPAQPVPVPTIG